MAFANAINDRYFEDYIKGDVHSFGSVEVTEDEIISFGKRFDPQRIHTDPDAAKLTPFGGIIASGWHTAGLMMRLYVERYMSHVASLVFPGLDELRWHKPVRPGDRLFLRVTILKRLSSMDCREPLLRLIQGVPGGWQTTVGRNRKICSTDPLQPLARKTV